MFSACQSRSLSLLCQRPNNMLWVEDLLPEGSSPKHLLWALYFLKVYTLHASGCAAGGATGSAINPKTH
jgi:hypothetical protein